MASDRTILITGVTCFVWPGDRAHEIYLQRRRNQAMRHRGEDGTRAVMDDK